jgi:20S proteasome alpha/beta subunit
VAKEIVASPVSAHALQPSQPDPTLRAMTVSVGVICEGGKAAVVAADRMVTYGEMGVQFEGDIIKFAEVSSHSVVASSGSFADMSYVLNRLKNLPGDSLNAISISQIAAKVLEAREALRTEQIEVLLLRRPLGLNMLDFQRVATTVPTTQIVSDIFKTINQHRMLLQLLVVGTDSDGAHLYSIDENPCPGNLDGFGFAAIGSGYQHATLSLARRLHLKSSSLAQAIYSTYEAKRAAELAIGVGRTTSMAVLQQGKPIQTMTEEDIQKLAGIYESERMKPRALSRSDLATIHGMVR